MRDDLRRLYRRLGYLGRLPREELGTVEAFAIPEQQDLPPLSRSDLESLQREFEQDPREVTGWFQKAWDAELSQDDLADAFSQVRASLDQPAAALAVMEAEALHLELAHALPEDFGFEGMDLARIPINPALKRFETRGDSKGWVIHAGPYYMAEKLGLVQKTPFRWHEGPEEKDFIYSLPEPREESIEIALFADFGTGLYHSLYIADQLVKRRPPVAIHLGDIYYAGRSFEFKEYFEAPLLPLLEHSELFVMNSNHEMLSGGKSYFDHLDLKASRANQRQKGSYFSLRNQDFQIVGIDTAYFGAGRYSDEKLLSWLQDVLAEGRNSKRTNILLSADHPYEYGERDLTELLDQDLRNIVLEEKLVDLWFWGNTHYCAFFDKSHDFPFFGSCIGHGGYPYTIRRSGDFSPAPVLFLEDQPRFPVECNLRPNRGNNGYCILQLGSDGVHLKYIDWMGKTRFETDLRRELGGLSRR